MASLSELAHKVAGGGRLSDEDARQLVATPDLVTVGMVAAEARRIHGGDGVTFVRVAEMARSTPVPDEGWPAAAREVRITGTPASVDEAVGTVRAVVARAGGRVVTGFSLADLWTLAAGEVVALTSLARALAEAGLSAVADVAVDAVSVDAASAGIGTLPFSKVGEALAAVQAAGLRAPVARWDAVPADPVAALRALRDLQERTRAFRAFAPLPRVQPPNAPETVVPQTGYDSVKVVALARVMLDNVPAIQVDWARHGPKLAQVALLFGASDLDAVSPSDESPLGHRRAPLEEVQRNITAAFLQPIERDGAFARVTKP